MDQAIAMGLLRHVLQLAGGFLMARGVVDSGAMELISGGGVRHVADLKMLFDAGCDRVLVATAMHQDDSAAQLFSLH